MIENMFICISYDLYFYPKQKLQYYIKYYASFFIIIGFYLLARFSVLGKLAQKELWWGGSVIANYLTMLKALAGYIRILFLPKAVAGRQAHHRRMYLSR